MVVEIYYSRPTFANDRARREHKVNERESLMTFLEDFRGMVGLCSSTDSDWKTRIPIKRYILVSRA